MEAIVALNMGNILNFYLEHSNYYLFFLFKFKDPLISLIIGTHNVRLEPSVSMQKLVLKILTKSGDIGKNVSVYVVQRFLLQATKSDHEKLKWRSEKCLYLQK